MSITQPSDATLYVVTNNGRTTLSTDITNSATTISVASITPFSSTGGVAMIYSTDSVTPGTEMITYTGTSGSDIIGVTRGVDTTSALNADQDDTIVAGAAAQHHNALRTSLQTLASETEALRDGSDFFDEIDMYKTGAVPDGLTIEIDVTNGGVDVKYDREESGQDMTFGPAQTSYEEVLKLGGSGGEVAVAADNFYVYSKDSMDVAGQLGVKMEPAEADGASAVAYQFKSINDLTNSNAAIMEVLNQSADALVVRKSQTEAVRYVATSTSAAPLNAPVFTSALGSPVDGDVWITDIASVRKFNARISGTTYSVTLT